jgi:hypothetical protein
LRFSGGTTNGGTSDYVDIGTTTNYGPKATVAVWVKFNKLDAATNGREAIVASKYWADDNFSLQLHDTDRILFTGGSAKYVGWSTDTGHLKTNTWHHLCLVYDKTQTTDAAATPLTNRVKLYIDGVLRTPIAYDGDFSAVDLKTDDGLKLGNTNNSGAQYCHDGEIRDVRIHNRALDSDEVAAAYNGNSTPFEYADASTADLIGANYGGSGTTWTGASGTTPPTGWTSGGTSPVFTIDSGTLKITAGTGNAWIKPTFNTTSGKRYRLEFRYVNTTGHVAQYSIDGSNFIDLANSTSWSSFSVEFDGTGSQPVHLVAKTTGHIVWFDDAKIYEIGEVAAYTPQSIDCSTKLAADYKWLDTTSNANHGTITGATSVGDNDHRGVLVVKGRSEHGDSDHNHSGCLYVGGQITSYAGRLDYNQGGYTELTLDNTNNHTSAKTSFGMKTAGTRLPVLELLGDGTVKATSGTSGNLRQVARTATDTIQGDGTAVAFEVVHNLGTKFVTVSVREKDNGAGQEYAYVDTEIRGGAWADSNGALEGVQANTEESQITVIFSSAPANGKDYYVTCIGA